MGALLKARWAFTDFVYDRLPRARMLQRQLDQATAEIARLSNEPPDRSPDADAEFSDAYPSHQAAIDLFQWTSAMPAGSGLAAGPNNQHFTDNRVMVVAAALQGLAGKTILELGPYEGYNTYQLEGMGAASVVAIESNRENFMKCLVVKNAFGLRSTFLHGDMLKYLDNTNSRFDICWASGVLYHMSDPLRLLDGLAKVSKVAFIWTCYYDKARANDDVVKNYFDPSKNKTVERDGKNIKLHHRNYNQKIGAYFSGGDQPFSYWMEKDDIFHVLKSNGFGRIQMLLDAPNHDSGAAMFFLAHAD